MEALNRQETEDLIVDLYYNQKKTFREIQKIVRKSPCDISAVLNKVEPERSSLSISSQAYRLFSEGKSPNQVAITLNIREPEATQFHREYWRLNQLYELDQFYEETKGNFSSFLELYRQMKAAGINVTHVIRLLKVANNNIPSVEYRYQQLTREAASLVGRNRNAARTLQQLTAVISETQNTLDHYSSLCKQERSEMDTLYQKKIQLEEFVECFKSNNKSYVKIKEYVKQEVDNTLTNPKQLLKWTLTSLIESLRCAWILVNSNYYIIRCRQKQQQQLCLQHHRHCQHQLIVARIVLDSILVNSICPRITIIPPRLLRILS
jgi:hypothetical protein